MADTPKYRIRLRWQVAELLDMSGAEFLGRRTNGKWNLYEVDARTLQLLIRETHRLGFTERLPGTVDHDRLREAFHHLRRVLTAGPIEEVRNG